jgi:hypothetical protein
MHETTGEVRETTALSVHASPVAAVLWARLRLPLAVAVAAGLLMSLTGAFRTDVMALAPRTLYWVFLTTLGTAIGLSTRPLVQRAGWFRADSWPEAVVVAGVIIALGTSIIWLVTGLAFGVPLRAGNIAYYLMPTAAITIAITALNYVLHRAAPVTHASPAASPAPPRFVDRLPAGLRQARLLAVEAQDHYLRMVTDQGESLILLRLSDALAELEGIEGAQTHRSWWVAREAVQGAKRGDGRAVLTLANGEQVPVSRTYAQSLRAEGWL